MSLKTIENENGVYVELPRDKINFISKDAEIIFDLSMENESLEIENKNLKSQIEYLRRSIVRKEETITELEQERVPYTNEYVEKVEKANAELKEKLEEANKKLYLCTPEIPQSVHGEYVSYVDLVNEIYELKKQLEERPKEYVFIGNAQNKTRDFINRITKDNKEYKIQQQEFINWLENGIEKVKNTEFLDERIQRAGLIAYNRCLQKYKKIIDEITN